MELALNMSKLRKLDLSYNDLTHVPLMLNSLPQLRDVSIAFNPITSFNNQSLSGIAERLRELDYRGLPLTEFEVSQCSLNTTILQVFDYFSLML